MARRQLLPLIVLFILVSGAGIVFRSSLEQRGYDQTVLLIGNLLLFAVTMLSFVMIQKGLRATSTHSFIRSVYGSFLMKLFICAGVVFAYVFTQKPINKPSLFTCLFLYLIYTFIEIRILFKMAKQRKNA